MTAWEQATGTPNVLSGSKVIFNAPMVAGIPPEALQLYADFETALYASL